MNANTKWVKCPSCQKLAEYSLENPFRPFCSERCQTLDLGAWASEEYTLPVEELSETEMEQLERVSSGNDSEFEKQWKH